jgi:hypothetical protein
LNPGIKVEAHADVDRPIEPRRDGFEIFDFIQVIDVDGDAV